jgi:hypothetical protein
LLDASGQTSVVLDAQQSGRQRPGPADAALHGADLAADQFSGGLVGHDLRSNEQQRLALRSRELTEVLPDPTQVAAGLLRGGGDDLPRLDAVRVLDLTLPLAALGVELVAQDGAEPGFEVAAGLEAVLVGPSLQQRLLNQVVGRRLIDGERDREGTQAR